MTLFGGNSINSKTGPVKNCVEPVMLTILTWMPAGLHLTLKAPPILQQTTISNFAAFSKITNKAWCFMRIVCWQTKQTILMKYHALFLRKSGKISQNLLSAAVVIGALRVNTNLWEQCGFNPHCFSFRRLWLEYILASYSVGFSINVGVKLLLNIVYGISIEGAKVKFLVYELRCALRNYFW